MSSTWKAVLGVILVFVLGCLCGTLTTSVYFNHRATLFFERGPAAYVDVMQNRLTRHLDLDATQQEQIHRFFMQNLQEHLRIQARLQPEMRTLNIEMVQEIESVLRPDQVPLFRKNLIEMRRRFNQFAPNDPSSGQTSLSLPVDNSKAPEN